MVGVEEFARRWIISAEELQTGDVDQRVQNSIPLDHGDVLRGD